MEFVVTLVALAVLVGFFIVLDGCKRRKASVPPKAEPGELATLHAENERLTAELKRAENMAARYMSRLIYAFGVDSPAISADEFASRVVAVRVQLDRVALIDKPTVTQVKQ